MRDPMSWSVPVFRAFGIPVRLHIFFIIIVIGLFFRQILLSQYEDVWWLDIVLLTVVVLFVSVLLHEFGHCFGARYVGGEARDILIWPLGGLATLDVPHRWGALFITTLAGPAVNILICIVCTIALVSAGFTPSLNPTADPHFAETKNFHNGRTYSSVYTGKIYKPGTAVEPTYDEFLAKRKEYASKNNTTLFPSPTDRDAYDAAIKDMGYERAVIPTWAVWAFRIFWLNWILFLFNMIPAYPLDGGQLLQSLVWARTDYRRGVVVAGYTGFAFAIVFVIVAIVWNESLILALAL
ncbi:MAG: site-2 protease family protein, partial [Planctomycetia bacterium]|nr:site-2 protease family protein [Planctomycetia bacterium]